MIVEDRSPAEWLEYWRSLTDDELLDERFRCYDAAELAERDSELHAFVKWAVAQIVSLECQRAACQTVALVLPEVDAATFVEAAIAINRGRRQLELERDVNAVLVGAYEVAERRAKEEDPDE